MSDSEPIPRVHFHLSVGDLPSAAWRVIELELQEAIAEPYLLSVTASVGGADVQAEALLAADATLEIRRGEATRRVSGLVSRVVDHGVRTDGRWAFELVVVPAMALAEQRVDTRIFQDRSVPELVAEVLGGMAGDAGRTIGSRCTAVHLPRDYCVQYRESDLGFARRLLEEEGMFYIFEQPDHGHERVLLVDDLNALPSFEGQDGSDEIPLADPTAELHHREVLHHFAWADALRSNAVVRSDFDPAQPAAPVVYELVGPRTGGTRSVYRHGERRRMSDDGAAQARRELDRLEAHRTLGRGGGNAIGLAAGTTFALVGRADLADARVLVTRIVHRGRAAVAHAADGDGSTYSNRFECVPAHRPFRLAESQPKPRTHGNETATVVGPASEEVHTDSAGRIKVRFHWDRSGRSDEDSSCWLRVVQGWAGNGFGAVVLPRVGMEVVVGFFAGNPDRPYVMGCLYNGSHAMPHAMPESKTKTTLRTRSSPNAEGYNEVSFEDCAGHEQMFVHAQRDLDEVIRAQHTVRVGTDELEHVGRDRGTTIDRHERHEVGKDSCRRIGGSQQVDVAGSQRVVVLGGLGAGEADEPAAPGAEVLVNGTYALSARDQIVLQCGQSSITLTPGAIVLSAASMIQLGVGGSSSTVAPDAIVQRSGAVTAETLAGARVAVAEDVAIESRTKVKLSVQETRLTLDPASARLRSLATSVHARSLLELSAGMTASLSASDVAVEATTVAVCGEASTRITGGGAEAVLEAGAVELNDG